jgi:AraC-like DNA-binding protein
MQSGWLAQVTRLLAAESMFVAEAGSLVLDRLAEALLLQTLRLFLDQDHESSGFVAAVRDPLIGRALLRLHKELQRNWSVDLLAREAGLSRSAFAEQFPKLVGETPMRYLARCRMQAGRRMLREGSLSTAEVARRVGYKSEFAFAKAFKRFFDMGPGAARRVPEE